MLKECEKLARELLVEANSDTEHGPLDLALTKLRIMRRFEASLDLTGAVAAARGSGATWEQVGATCGMTKQAAYERWRTPVKALKDGATLAQKDAQSPVDPLDEFDTSFVVEGRPTRRRRRSS